MEIKCLQCGRQVPQTPGKRKKEYCGPTCRTKFWKKKKDAGKVKKGPGRPKKETVVQNKLIEAPIEGKQAVIPKPRPEAIKPSPQEQEIPSGLSKTDMLKWHRAKNFNR